MTGTAIIGIGQTSVSEKWETSLRHLAWYAVEAALDDAALSQGQIDAVFVGNLLAGTLSNQRHLATLTADFAGLRGAEAVVVEAGEASGGAAVRQAVLAVSSGLIKTALVVGVEKTSDTTGALFTSAEATVLDAEYEQIHGLTLEAAAALMMRRYLHEYGVEVQDFANFSVNAHANGSKNSLAMYRNRLKAEKFTAAPMLADPVTLFDAAPAGDGAAALVIVGTEKSADLSPHPVRIAGSALVTDALSLHDRADLLWLEAAAKSARRAMQMADVTHDEIDLFELHDAFTILAALSLEAAGFAPQGQGVQLARNARIMPDGTIPTSTFGGLKARGNPYGATGVYQIVEVARQLRGQAGPNQIADARIGMAQNLGGLGATAVTHILRV
jgi:acetyl-CoA C-acetyltransferase